MRLTRCPPLACVLCLAQSSSVDSLLSLPFLSTPSLSYLAPDDHDMRLMTLEEEDEACDVLTEEEAPALIHTTLIRPLGIIFEEQEAGELFTKITAVLLYLQYCYTGADSLMLRPYVPAVARVWMRVGSCVGVRGMQG